MIKKASLLLVAAASLSTPLPAQMADMPGMPPATASSATPSAQAPVAPLPADPVPADAASPASDMAGMDHAMPGMNHDMAAMPSMRAMLGPYSMMREASGTSWQPDSTPMVGMQIPAGAWTMMLHGFATLSYDDQGGPRGDSKTFSQSMAMVMASRPVGDRGTLGLRAMASLDPLMGRRGYPLLFATGETANGRDQLVDRQHPHDFLMEISASYARDLGQGRSLYIYGGLPGEPALGPPTFMHRMSGMDIPEAPITHHWFDSTHITFGVVTAGYSAGPWKIEASAFKGREPDQRRWDVETPRLDSWAVRGFWNPTANLTIQLSTGRIHSPEQLHAHQDEQRTTASATWNVPLGKGGNWATTVAWSRKDGRPGPTLDGWLGETVLRLRARHILFARLEHVQENELFETGQLAETVIPVSKLSAGYAYEVPIGEGPVRMALGGLASGYAFPDRLKPAYGKEGVKSFMLFVRLRLANTDRGE